MNHNLIYQTLKMQYGSLAQVAKEANVTTQTVRNILIKNVASECRETVLSVAQKIADKILISCQQEAEEKILALKNEISQYDKIRQQLAA